MSDNSGGTTANNASVMADNTSTTPENNGSIFNNPIRATTDDDPGPMPDSAGVKKRRLSNDIVEAEIPKWQLSKKRRRKKPITEPAELRRSQRANRGQRNIRAIVHYTEVSDVPINSKDTFPILDLPREIRDMIYDRLFRKIVINTRSYGMKFRAVYGMEVSELEASTFMWYRHSIQGLPLWLLSNRQILSEGLEQFHRQADFSYFGNSYQAWKKTGKEGMISISKAKTLDLSRLTRHNSTGLKWVLDTDGDRKGKLFIEFKQPYDTEIRNIVSQLDRYPSVLQDLTMKFEATYWFHNLWARSLNPIGQNLPADSELHTAIGFLDKLPRGLNRVTIGITMADPRRDGGWPLSRKMLDSDWRTRVMPVLCTELKRVGLALVLGPGQQITDNETMINDHRQWRTIQVISTQWKGPGARTQA
jgi:hypothetical protein